MLAGQEASMDGSTLFDGPSRAGGPGSGRRPVAPPGGGALRDRHQDGDRLGSPVQRDRQYGGQADGRLPAEEDRWPAPRLAAGALSAAGLYPARLGRRAGRARLAGRLPDGLGLRSQREADIQKKTLVASERDRPDVAHRRLQWMAYQNRIDPARLVFIDETWTKTNMAPLRGWAPCGQRLPGKAPYGRWKTMTFLAALRRDRVTAPWLIDGPIDGQSFLQYVEQVLVPTLRPGDIVIVDNLGSHKGKAVRRAIRAVGAKLFFLPKYSPDLNPIEKFFAKLKHWLRKAARRTIDAVYNAVAEILPLTSPAECSNYFEAGYAQPQTITL